MVSQKFTTQNAVETQELAARLAGKIKGLPAGRQGGAILALYGELGSGKTTFVQGLARGLGIKKRILSPSFTLIRQYKISPPRSPFQLRQGFAGRVGHLGGGEATTSTPARCNTLYHVDLYRIENEKDVEGLGLKEIWSDPKNIVAIEWAEKIASILPEKRLDIYFEDLGGDERKIIMKMKNGK